MTQETKLGIFVLAGLTALVVTVIMLGNFQFQRIYKLNILFSDIAGLPSKAKVKIAGVDVGAVKDIALEGNKARVGVWIKKGVVIHRDARARIVSTGIIGSKYLELTIGSPDQPPLLDGDTINGINPVSIEEVATQVMQRIDELTKSFGGAEGGKGIGENLSATVANLREVSDTLRVALADQEEKLVNIVDNVNQFTGDLADISSRNKENIRIAIQDIRKVAERMNNVLAKIDGGEGAIGKLVTDQQMGQDLKDTFVQLRETSKQANNVLRRLNLIETQWDYHLRRDMKYNVSRYDLGLRIIPRPGKMYYIGGSNLGIADNDVLSHDPEEMNTIDFLIGQQFGPALVYGGVIRSRGGVGTRVRPLWKWDPWRRLEVNVDAYSFTREVPIAKPKINTGVRVELTNWAYVGAQWEDLYYASSLNTYFNLILRDDDIAYILGLVGLAKP